MNIANKSIKDWSNLTQYYKKCGTKKYKKFITLPIKNIRVQGHSH